MRIGKNIVTLLLLVLLWSTGLSAQQPSSELPSAPSQTQARPPEPKEEIPPAPVRTERIPPHRFWDKTNILLFNGVAAFRGLDYASTRNMLARGREEILLPDDVVKNSAGFASLEAAGTAASVGVSYIMHRTGHHKVERWVSIVHISVTAFGAGRNYALKTHRPVASIQPAIVQ